VWLRAKQFVGGASVPQIGDASQPQMGGANQRGDDAVIQIDFGAAFLAGESDRPDKKAR